MVGRRTPQWGVITKTPTFNLDHLKGAGQVASKIFQSLIVKLSNEISSIEQCWRAFFDPGCGTSTSSEKRGSREAQGSRVVPQRLALCRGQAQPAQIRVGMAVEAVFEQITDEITLPKFRPAG